MAAVIELVGGCDLFSPEVFLSFLQSTLKGGYVYCYFLFIRLSWVSYICF